ncbi:MAG: hypothetical protein GXY08_04700 [Ruminococcus sp.]|nr:hypothetical protein [Ruminococcus sp.]
MKHRSSAIIAASALLLTGCAKSDKGTDDNVESEVIVTVEATEETSEAETETENETETDTTDPAEAEDETSEEETKVTSEETSEEETTEADTKAAVNDNVSSNVDADDIFFKLQSGMSKDEVFAITGTDYCKEDVFKSIATYEWYLDNDKCFGTDLPYCLYIEFMNDKLHTFSYMLGVKGNTDSSGGGISCYANGTPAIEFPCSEKEITSGFDKVTARLDKEFGPFTDIGDEDSYIVHSYMWTKDKCEIWSHCQIEKDFNNILITYIG